MGESFRCPTTGRVSPPHVRVARRTPPRRVEQPFGEASQLLLDWPREKPESNWCAALLRTMQKDRAG